MLSVTHIHVRGKGYQKRIDFVDNFFTHRKYKCSGSYVNRTISESLSDTVKWCNESIKFSVNFEYRTHYPKCSALDSEIIKINILSKSFTTKF